MKNMKTHGSKILLTTTIMTLGLALGSPRASADTFMNGIREGLFLLVGYPENENPEGPPKDGLIAFLDLFAKGAVTF